MSSHTRHAISRQQCTSSLQLDIFGSSEHIARLGSEYRTRRWLLLTANLVGDHWPLTIHAEETQLIAVTMKVHYALIDSFRAIPKIETEQLASVVIAVRTRRPTASEVCRPDPRQDVPGGMRSYTRNRGRIVARGCGIRVPGDPPPLLSRMWKPGRVPARPSSRGLPR